jgi:hypothetical protein
MRKGKMAKAMMVQKQLFLGTGKIEVGGIKNRGGVSMSGTRETTGGGGAAGATGMTGAGVGR